MLLLNLQPICPDLPCRPIHVLGSETANSNEPVRRRIDEIIDWLRLTKISVLGIAFDGANATMHVMKVPQFLECDETKGGD
jgi:hypothetical protein